MAMILRRKTLLLKTLNLLLHQSLALLLILVVINWQRSHLITAADNRRVIQLQVTIPDEETLVEATQDSKNGVLEV